MRVRMNKRERTKVRYSHGYMTEEFYGNDIKIWKYRGIAIASYNHKTKEIVMYDWREQIANINRSADYRRYYTKRTPQTIRHKYNFCMPPGITVHSKLGRTGGYAVRFLGDKSTDIRLVHRMLIPYDGVI